MGLRYYFSTISRVQFRKILILKGKICKVLLKRELRLTCVPLSPPFRFIFANLSADALGGTGDDARPPPTNQNVKRSSPVKGLLHRIKRKVGSMEAPAPTPSRQKAGAMGPQMRGICLPTKTKYRLDRLA